MLLSTVFYGAMQLCVKYLADFPVLEIVFFRSIITFVSCLTLLKIQGVKPWGNDKKRLLGRGVFGVIALTCYLTTIQHMPLASAVTIQFLNPVITAVLGIWLLRERVLPLQWLFFALSLAGVVAIKGFDARVELLYLFIGVGGAFFTALAYNMIRGLRKTDHPLVVVLYFAVVALPTTGIYTAMEWHAPTPTELAWLFGAGIFSLLGQYCTAKGLQFAEAGRLTSVKYIGILYALAIGYFLFGESYNWLTLFGIVLVLVGVVLNVTYRSSRR